MKAAEFNNFDNMEFLFELGVNMDDTDEVSFAASIS